MIKNRLDEGQVVTKSFLALMFQVLPSQSSSTAAWLLVSSPPPPSLPAPSPPSLPSPHRFFHPISSPTILFMFMTIPSCLAMTKGTDYHQLLLLLFSHDTIIYPSLPLLLLYIPNCPVFLLIYPYFNVLLLYISAIPVASRLL